MSSRADELNALGQSVWLDFIRRGHMVSGEFDDLVAHQGIVGVTSNPTIFQHAISKSDDYDGFIEKRVADGMTGAPLFEQLIIEDIQMACDRLGPTFSATDGKDGRVSIEVNPHLARDTQGTIEEARRLRSRVDRPNVMVKVPATTEGLPAITQLTADGISINVTLIFSLERYAEVMEAYIAGLEKRVEAGESLGDIRSVASFFVSRVDTKVDKAIEARLEELDGGSSERKALAGLRGMAAIANARLAYKAFKKTFTTSRFKALSDKGANLQRPLWASTSTKNPEYRDVIYVEELIGPDTVNTMPLQTLEAFNDHGTVEPRIERDVDAAEALFRRLPELGIPLNPLIGELEEEGVVAFAKSFDAALESLENKRVSITGAS